MVIAVAVIYLTYKVFYGFFRGDKTADDGKVIDWFGKGNGDDGEEDSSIRPFKVDIPEEVLVDLRQRLERTRFEPPLEDIKFNYGFNSDYLQQVVKYWKDEYNWRKEEVYLNQFPHFKTKILGLDVHFVRVQPTLPPGSDMQVVPILMVHGWPGSFLEFYKILPLLTTPSSERDFVFEVVCPSIPGYGFSESPCRKGLDATVSARMFRILMQDRLGHKKFYVQGGDWGSFITSIMARKYPECVLGVHLNMFGSNPKGLDAVKALIVAYLPFLIPKEQFDMFYPIKDRAAFFMQETGYFHLQTTKPDTVGCGMTDSPAGMAAYILEKFSTWTLRDGRDLQDGGLLRKYTLDELLTNVMLYWVNNNFTASVRFYKENVDMINKARSEQVPITVPCGLALFPQELMGMPRCLMSSQVKDLVTYNVLPRGGHFAAFEEPQLLAEDVINFVAAVRQRSR
ncbi:hypothetical protein JTE90_027862 [Oedothorax gibbosus]|uniref:Epoxide hydrolase n=1 Tax=Oedothorax gibbosus TaxID=931172 RepID=A0AAV6U700_9ARAC|nr:hypothetical protein JTE90_027862 [Oedothorax gibbosus]